MTMITPSYLGETIEYSSLHACRSTLEDPTAVTPTRLEISTRFRDCSLSAGATLLFADDPASPGGFFEAREFAQKDKRDAVHRAVSLFGDF